MLLALQIENYAIIKSLQISFDSGFTAITGETGAGKSIIIGALSLILGNRVDTSILYDKSKKCFVEGTFNLEKLNIKPFFEQNDLDYQKLTILRREISETGKSRAFVNDTPVTLSQLKELAQYLVDIHSQHHHLLIENQGFKLKIIDEYSQNIELVEQYQQKREEYKKTCLELDHLLEAKSKSIQENDYFEFLNNELLEANLTIGELEEIEKQISILSNAELIKTKLFQSSNIIHEDPISILSSLQELKGNCASISTFDEKFQSLTNRINSVIIEMKDIDFEISSITNEIEVNPDHLQLLNERLDQLNKLLQKHRVHSISELIEKHQFIQLQLSQFSDSQEKIDLMNQKKSELYIDLNQIGDSITSTRKSNIESLEREIIEKITSIGIPDGMLKIHLESTDQFLEFGKDKVSFLFSANKGISLAEVEKVASGGEISRLMLAIKSVISTKNILPTVIFDEIDTGISGDVAGKVSRLMQKIASDRQLLVITHLPQIAAKAKIHYFVYKEVIDNKTYTNIKELKGNERVEEIAAMMSGDTITLAARQTAQELIFEN